jgi:hypothetical protein
VQPFLTANWRYLAMLNYVVDPRLIAPLYVAVPMRHEIEHLHGSVKVEYSWRCGRKWESLK